MKKSDWKKIKIGDFFVADMKLNGQTLLYQKIDETKVKDYNAILLNTGELVNIFISPLKNEHFQKVEVTFDVTPID